MKQIRLHGTGRNAAGDHVPFAVVVDVYEDNVDHEDLFRAMFPHASYDYSSLPEEDE